MILGIDWGQKKIGIAIAHEEVNIASPLMTIVHDHRVYDQIAHIVDMHHVQLIVIGKSVHLSQNDNVSAIEIFASKCQKACNVPIVYVTEMFSTREAQNNLIKAGRRNIAQHDDAEAARIILQQYLDAQNHPL